MRGSQKMLLIAFLPSAESSALPRFRGGSSAGYFSAVDKSDKAGDRCHQVDERCQVLCGEDGEEINLKPQVCHEPVESLTGQCEKLKVETDEIRRTQAGPAAFCIAADHRSTAAANRRAQNSRWALCVDRILMSQIRGCMTQYPNSSPDMFSRFIYLGHTDRRHEGAGYAWLACFRAETLSGPSLLAMCTRQWHFKMIYAENPYNTAKAGLCSARQKQIKQARGNMSHHVTLLH